MKHNIITKKQGGWHVLLRSIYTTVLPSAVIPVGLALLFNLFLESWRWKHDPFHALIEGTGSFGAILLSLIIIGMRNSGQLRPAYIWVATTLMGMGLLDGFHAGVYPGNIFVWLHSIATFVGGTAFAMVVLPERISRKKAIAPLPYIIAVLSVFTGIVSIVFPEIIPLMVDNGSFTAGAAFLNLTGGVGFIAAWIFFNWSKRFRGSEKEKQLLANHCLLFGVAGLLFHFSALWDATWWLWHVLRFFAYMVILWFFVTIYLDNVAQIKRNKKDVELLAARLKSILDSALDGIVIIDRQGIIEIFNPAAEKIFGYTREEIQGSNIAILVSEKEGGGDPFEGMFIGSKDRVFAASSKEITGVRRDGTEFPLEISLNKIDSEDYPMIVGIVRDVTERKRFEKIIIDARDDAEKANRAKSQFLSSMSHELRTPLNAILGFGQLLELDPDMSENHRDHIGEILNSGNHLLALINEVLDLAKIESGKLEILMEAVELGKLVDEAVSLVRPLAAKKNINITLNPEDNILVTADYFRLKQVIINLLSNAVKYNHVNGEAGIETRTENGRVRILVSDNGVGISQDNMEKLFEPFTRFHQGDEYIEGTGIGLTICRELAALMGGSIHAESEPGKGSVFTVELPV